MAYPDKPQILTSYTAEEQSIGNGMLPGQELDVDFASLKTSMEQVIDFVKLFTRSDGQLANGIVTTEALAASVRIGFDPPEVWATAQAYTTRSTVFQGQQFYLCTIAHTSGVFATDWEAGRWQLLADLTPPGGALLATNNLSDLIDAAIGRSNLGLGTMATLNTGTSAGQFRTNTQNEAVFQPLDSDLTAIAGLSSNGIVVRTGAGTAAVRTITAGAGVTVTNGDGVSGNPTISAAGVPAGAVMHFAMNSPPTGWLKANGALVSRTTYADLFAAIGTTFGAGDGSTTFALPDLRAEFVRGWDDARGVDSGRAFGSAQSSQNLAHSHTGSTDSAGAHTHTFPLSNNLGVSNAHAGRGSGTNDGTLTTSSSGAHTHTLTINNDGGTEARPRNIALLACIKF